MFVFIKITLQNREQTGGERVEAVRTNGEDAAASVQVVCICYPGKGMAAGEKKWMNPKDS